MCYLSKKESNSEMLNVLFLLVISENMQEIITCFTIHFSDGYVVWLTWFVLQLSIWQICNKPPSNWKSVLENKIFPARTTKFHKLDIQSSTDLQINILYIAELIPETYFIIPTWNVYIIFTKAKYHKRRIKWNGICSGPHARWRMLLYIIFKS